MNRIRTAPRRSGHASAAQACAPSGGSPRRGAASGARCAALAAALLAAVLPAAAQFKWTDPDGRTVYGDNPPASARAVQRVAGFAAPQPGPLDGLPFELRRTAERYPVVLYTSSPCVVCEQARALLRGRGIPYTERQVGTEADQLAYQRLPFGGRVPALQVGSQAQAGFETGLWNTMLDTAGYPASSRLPRGWPAPVPRPLVESPAPARPPVGEPPPADATEVPATASRPQ